jgi:hypothetical protein
MPNTKISDLADASALDGSEFVPMVQGGADRKATTQEVADLSGWALVSTQVASNSALLEFTGLDPDNYHYKIIGSRLIPATDAVTITCQFGTGPTPTYQTSNYYYAGQYRDSNNGGGSLNSANGSNLMSAFVISNTTSGAAGCQIAIDLMDQSVMGSFMAKGQPVTYYIWETFGSAWNGTGPVTAIKFFFSSGNIASGKLSLYRMAK